MKIMSGDNRSDQLTTTTTTRKEMQTIGVFEIKRKRGMLISNINGVGT
jgi:hypothetical protein